MELLVAATLVVTLGGIALPDARHLVDAVRGETELSRAQAAVHIARTAAVMYGHPATLCPLDAAGRCDGAWSEGFALFLDVDRDARRDPGERLLRRFPGTRGGARLQFRAFRTSRYLRLLPSGQTDWQNGAFTWCPPPGSGLAPRAVVINVQGRARRTHDDWAAGRCG